MKKFLLGMLTITALMMFTGCAEEEDTPVAAAPKYAVKLADSTVLDAENSYFLITVDNAKKVDNVTLKKEPGESEEAYQYRLDKAVAEAKSKGTYIKVEGNGVQTETTVLNKDNGTLNDETKPVLVLVKERAATPNKPNKPKAKASKNEFQIQILIKANDAVKARSIYLTVDRQKFLYNNFKIMPLRTWTDEFGNPVTSLNVPDDVKNESGNVVKKGVNMISMPSKVNVYSYDKTTKEAVGPVPADSNITGKLSANLAAPYVIDNYKVDTTATIKGFPSCLKDGKGKCGINISGYYETGIDKVLSVSTDTAMNKTTKVASSFSLPLYGTKTFGYTISPRASSYLEEQSSVAVFDIKVDAAAGIAADQITVQGLEKAQDTVQSLTDKQYVIKTDKTDNSVFNIVMLASTAATQAATAEGLVISVKGANTVFTSSQVKVSKMAEVYIAGEKIDKPYQLIYNSSVPEGLSDKTKVYLKINSFGPAPVLYSYTGGNINTIPFGVTLKTINPSNGISVDKGTCVEGQQAVDCEFSVSATQNISSNTPSNVTVNFEDGIQDGTTQLPATEIQFFTTNVASEEAEQAQ